MPRTTHTLEMSQLAELNRRLSEHEPKITAADVGLEEAKPIAGQPHHGLPGSAVLVRLCWDGPPDFPYIHAHFALADQGEGPVVDLHTAALRELGRRLGVHQQWGA